MGKPLTHVKMAQPQVSRNGYTKRGYRAYVLLLLTFCFLLNNLDRYVLLITSKPMANDMHFGDRNCVCQTSRDNDTASAMTSDDPILLGKASNKRCGSTTFNATNSSNCNWQYSGTGIEYELLAGPLFMVVFGITGILVSFLSEFLLASRKIMLAICVLLWSLMTVLTGLANNYWKLALTRFALGIFEAGCTPFSASLISDMFSAESQGTALGIFNWGIYTGFSLVFVFNFVWEAYGWRWVFYAAGMPGLLVGFLVLVTVREPRQHSRMLDSKELPKRPSLRQICRTFVNAPLILLCISGAVRNGAGLIWAYHIQIFFTKYHPGVETGYYLSWIPLVGGALGALFGGFVSDKLRKHRGQKSRVWVLILSQIVAVPFIIGMLYLQSLWAFFSYIPALVFGEMWIGVCLAAIVELVQPNVRATSVALYLLIMNTVGGNINVLVSPLSRVTSLRTTLLILYPGMYLASSALFALALCSIRFHVRRSNEDSIGEKEPLLGSFERSTSVDTLEQFTYSIANVDGFAFVSSAQVL